MIRAEKKEEEEEERNKEYSITNTTKEKNNNIKKFIILTGQACLNFVNAIKSPATRKLRIYNYF
jgi:hypothetical protein